MEPKDSIRQGIVLENDQPLPVHAVASPKAGNAARDEQVGTSIAELPMHVQTYDFAANLLLSRKFIWPAADNFAEKTHQSHARYFRGSLPPQSLWGMDPRSGGEKKQLLPIGRLWPGQKDRKCFQRP